MLRLLVKISSHRLHERVSLARVPRTSGNSPAMWPHDRERFPRLEPDGRPGRPRAVRFRIGEATGRR
jgi:hypothetical protein